MSLTALSNSKTSTVLITDWDVKYRSICHLYKHELLTIKTYSLQNPVKNIPRSKEFYQSKTVLSIKNGDITGDTTTNH